jgi:pimeloyl-ACP methyl ester carboxylesterase
MFMDFDTFGLPYTFPNPPRLFDSRGGKHPGHPHAGSFFALVGAESQPEGYEVCCPCGSFGNRAGSTSRASSSGGASSARRPGRHDPSAQPRSLAGRRIHLSLPRWATSSPCASGLQSVIGRYWAFTAKYPIEAYSTARDVPASARVRPVFGTARRPFRPHAHNLGQVIEELILTQGRLGCAPLARGSLRERVPPMVELLGGPPGELLRLHERIAQAWLIIWAHQDPLTPIEDAFPALQRLLDNPRATIRSWEHRTISPDTTIYVGFLREH